MAVTYNWFGQQIDYSTCNTFSNRCYSCYQLERFRFHSPFLCYHYPLHLVTIAMATPCADVIYLNPAGFYALIKNTQCSGKETGCTNVHELVTFHTHAFANHVQSFTYYSTFYCIIGCYSYWNLKISGENRHQTVFQMMLEWINVKINHFNNTTPVVIRKRYPIPHQHARWTDTLSDDVKTSYKNDGTISRYDCVLWFWAGSKSLTSG